MKINRSVALLPIAAAVVALVGACDDGSDNASSSTNKQGSAVMCERFIKKDSRIKSPGSLKFSGVSETKIKVVKSNQPFQYKVTGWIDSQNDFGAYKRNRYSCLITKSNKDTWKLNELQFLTHN